MDVIEVLHGARSLLERGWCQGMPAVDRLGQPTDVDGVDAVAWCLVGSVAAAVHRAVPPEEAVATELATLAALRREVSRPAEWNDAADRDHLEVLGALDRAIHRQSAMRIHPSFLARVAAGS